MYTLASGYPLPAIPWSDRTYPASLFAPLTTRALRRLRNLFTQGRELSCGGRKEIGGQRLARYGMRTHHGVVPLRELIKNQ